MMASVGCPKSSSSVRGIHDCALVVAAAAASSSLHQSAFSEMCPFENLSHMGRHQVTD